MADSEHNEHGLSHVMSKKALIGTWAALMVLTIITVYATAIDLGSNANLLVAMIIATIKAALVCMFFMHLIYDRGFHAVIFATSLVFVLLFVTFAMMDTFQYRPSRDAYILTTSE